MKHFTKILLLLLSLQTAVYCAEPTPEADDMPEITQEKIDALAVKMSQIKAYEETEINKEFVKLFIKGAFMTAPYLLCHPSSQLGRDMYGEDEAKFYLDFALGAFSTGLNLAISSRSGEFLPKLKSKDVSIISLGATKFMATLLGIFAVAIKGGYQKSCEKKISELTNEEVNEITIRAFNPAKQSVGDKVAALIASQPLITLKAVLLRYEQI